ncbi:MAG TPA: hypothetical protein VFA68_13180, partial [Terriglobales bacterium]|nr:hypothetical protein [Terriglobales bacterium]
MKHARDCGRAFLALLLVSFLNSCANPGVPLPPELELPRRVGDLHAVRKGDKVYLSWTVPNETVDHQTIRHAGPTRVCRSVDPNPLDCDHPIVEVPPSSFPAQPKAKKGQAVAKVQASYTDTLPAQLQEEHPADLLTYAVTVMNQSGRSAGPSNIAQVPAALTLHPSSDLQAQVTASGVALSWTNPAAPASNVLRFIVRIYRRPEDSKADNVAGEIPLSGDRGEWLDQTFEWEKTYLYHLTIVTNVSRPGKPDLQV